MPSPVDDALQHTFHIYRAIKELLKSKKRSVRVSKQTLRDWKLRLGQANVCVHAATKEAFGVEDRLRAEAAMLRSTVASEALDRAANQARVYDRLRFIADVPAGKSNIDWAISSAAKIEDMLSALCPAARIDLSGANAIREHDAAADRLGEAE